MSLKLTNNAASTLASAISDTATTITIQSADAGKFPTLGADDWSRATLTDALDNIEIVKVTARSGAVLTVLRGQEGTTARAWAAGDDIGCRLTAGGLEELAPLGKHTIFVPAGAMTPATTNGAARGSGETATNKVMRSTLDFDASVEEFAQFGVQMPRGWDESTLIAQFIWSHLSTATNFGVVWGVEAVAFADGDALDAAWGTEVATADIGGTTDDIFISPESAAITVAGSPGNEEYVMFRITRVVGNASDTMAVDARLHGVKIHYTTNAATDD